MGNIIILVGDSRLDTRRNVESELICEKFLQGITDRNENEGKYWNHEDFIKIAQMVAMHTVPYIYTFVDYETAMSVDGIRTSNTVAKKDEPFACIDQEHRIVYLYAPVSEKWLKRKAIVDKAMNEIEKIPHSSGLPDYDEHALAVIRRTLELSDYEFEKATIVRANHDFEVSEKVERELLLEEYDSWNNSYDYSYVLYHLDFDEESKEIVATYVVTHE